MALGSERARASVTAAAHDVHAPSAASAAVRDIIRDAAAARTPLRIVAAGQWLDAGRPVAEGSRILALAGDSGIVDYVPGDLTLTARAGTSLATITRATAAEGQRLALDPFGSDAGTIGATIATGSAGPLAHLFGGPRDNVLGLEFITGAGTIARGGGRVVKNVAGFDLARLLTGSWGTLGVISEVTLRLRALPEREDTIAIALPDDADALAEKVERSRVLPAAPWALELVNDVLSRHLGLGGGTRLLVRLGGNETVVASQRETFASIGALSSTPPDTWERLRIVEPAGAVVFRLSDLPSRMAFTWREAERCVGRFPGAMLHATVGRGVVRCIIPHAAIEAEASTIPLQSLEAHPLVRALGVRSAAPARIFERLPAPLWPVLAPSPANDRLSRGVRSAYDPHRILNAGILGDSHN